LTIDTDKLEGERKRGHDAEALLDNPLFVEAKAAIRNELLKAWEASPARDTEGRERIWISINLLEKLTAAIAMHATTGKLAAKQLTDMGDRKKFLGVI
jgi:hypothetical protein